MRNYFFFFACARSDAIGPRSRFGVLGSRKSLPACEAIFFEVAIFPPSNCLEQNISQAFTKGDEKAKWAWIINSVRIQIIISSCKLTNFVINFLLDKQITFLYHRFLHQRRIRIHTSYLTGLIFSSLRDITSAKASIPSEQVEAESVPKMIALPDPLVARLLEVLHGEEQIKAHCAVERLRVIIEAYSERNSTEPFPVLVVPVQASQASEELIGSRQ